MAIVLQSQLALKDELREILQDTNSSLISMDRQRLEEMAGYCEQLVRGAFQSGTSDQRNLDWDATEDELKLLECVLRETRANLAVLLRLHFLRISATNRTWQR